MGDPAERTDPATGVVLDFERPIVDLERKIDELIRVGGDSPDLRPQIAVLESRARDLQKEIFADLTAWQKVQLSRHPARPYTLDYIERLVEDFVELHGDRHFADDPAVVAGFGIFEGTPVMVVGQQKGGSTKDPQPGRKGARIELTPACRPR